LACENVDSTINEKPMKLLPPLFGARAEHRHRRALRCKITRSLLGHGVSKGAQAR
jgi:hypothetical protein